MSIRLAAVAVIGVILSMTGVLLSQNPGSGDQKELLQVLSDQQKAWNQGRLDLFMETYWKSEELSYFSGNTLVKGWQALLDRYERRYRGTGEALGQVSFSELKVEKLGPDHALIRGRWNLIREGEDPLGGLFSLILQRFDEGWKIIHDHTSG
jgi:beta-aspartyl-peptidase (threonine type)